MRTLTILLLALALPLASHAQTSSKTHKSKPAASKPAPVAPPTVVPAPVAAPAPAPAAAPVDPPAPDGFNKYYFVMLTKGEKRDQDRATLVKLMEQHLDYVEKMANERKFLFDGTMMDDGALRGFLIVKAASIAEAKTLAESDAMVQAGRVACEVHPCMTESGALEKAGDAAPAMH